MQRVCEQLLYRLALHLFLGMKPWLLVAFVLFHGMFCKFSINLFVKLLADLAEINWVLDDDGPSCIPNITCHTHM